LKEWLRKNRLNLLILLILLIRWGPFLIYCVTHPNADVFGPAILAEFVGSILGAYVGVHIGYKIYRRFKKEEKEEKE